MALCHTALHIQHPRSRPAGPLVPVACTAEHTHAIAKPAGSVSSVLTVLAHDVNGNAALLVSSYNYNTAYAVEDQSGSFITVSWQHPSPPPQIAGFITVNWQHCPLPLPH
jgi:hypothetical protein